MLRVHVGALSQQELTMEPVQLRLPPALVSPFDRGNGVAHFAKCVISATGAMVGRREKSTQHRAVEQAAGRFEGRELIANLVDASLDIPRLGDAASAQRGTRETPEWEIVDVANVHRGGR